jgi:subtilase family serine protease
MGDHCSVADKRIRVQYIHLADGRGSARQTPHLENKHQLGRNPMKAFARERAEVKPFKSMMGIAVTCLSMAATGTALAATDGARNSAPAPLLLKHSTDLGAVDPSSTIEITMWLKLRDEKALDNALTAQRENGAPYLSNAQIDSQLAPTTASVADVSRFLTSRGLQVTGIGPHNLFVKASGSVALIQSTLGVDVHQYQLKDMTFHASTKGVTLPAELAPLVASVSGLNGPAPQPNIARAVMGLRSKPSISHASDAEGLAGKPVRISASGGSNGLVYAAQCFLPPISQSFSGGGVSATYTGNRYGTDINNTAAGTVAPCGYQPSDIATAYDMNALYKAGLDGTGQTVAIVDAYGSKTIAADAAAFSAIMGLPPVNLTIIGTPTETNFSTDANAGWAGETTLDVEWVHSIAPGAKIILVVTPTNSFSDLFGGVLTAAQQPGVVAISNSWSGLEAGLDPTFQKSSDAMFKLIDAQGISMQFATGDSGDNVTAAGFYDVGWPASSPNVTAVGGVSLALKKNKQIAFQTAWGNNITEIADTIALGSPPLEYTNNEGFTGGGGGGKSDVYPQPNFQRGIPGQTRKIPDISWLADPFTGVEIIFTGDADGDLAIEVIGGTSLATPMFSGLWAIANQKARHPLGNAAPYLYRLPGNAITDIDAVSSSDNVVGTVTSADGTEFWDSRYLALPLQGEETFYSALYNSPFSTRWFVLTFGTDSTLHVGPGFDTATGLGTPDGWNFVQAFGHGN